MGEISIENAIRDQAVSIIFLQTDNNKTIKETSYASSRDWREESLEKERGNLREEERKVREKNKKNTKTKL